MAKKTHYCFITRQIPLPGVGRLLGLRFCGKRKCLLRENDKVVGKFTKHPRGKMVYYITLSVTKQNQSLIDKLEEDPSGRFEEFSLRETPQMVLNEKEVKIGAFA